MSNYAIVEPAKVKGAKSVGLKAFTVPFGEETKIVIEPMQVVTLEDQVVGLVSPSGLGQRAVALDCVCSAYSSDPAVLLESFERRHQQVLARGVTA